MYFGITCVKPQAFALLTTFRFQLDSTVINANSSDGSISFFTDSLITVDACLQISSCLCSDSQKSGGPELKIKQINFIVKSCSISNINSS